MDLRWGKEGWEKGEVLVRYVVIVFDEMLCVFRRDVYGSFICK